MTGAPKELPASQFRWALAGLAAAGWLLRAAPLAGAHGAWGVRPDYDEGVYFSAAALLWRGHLPYRDFLFVHPPGIALLLAPLTGLSHLALPDRFALARWAVTFTGAGSVLLCGLLGRRLAGPVAGLVAAGLYAVYPEAVAVERGLFIEPFVNVLCLAAAVLSQSGGRRVWGAGALLGVAITFKLWAGIWLFALLVTLPPDERRENVVGLLAGALAGFLLTTGPLALAAPGAFVHDAIGFQLSRPPDHLTDRWARAKDIFAHQHAAAWLLAALGFLRVLLQPRRVEPLERTFAVAYALTLAAFFAARSFWWQYDAFLAPAEVLLAASAAGALWRQAGASGMAAQIAVSLLITAGLGLAARETARVNAAAEDAVWIAARDALAKGVSEQACLFSLEPAWGIAAGLLPDRWVDPYASMLDDAAAGTYASARDAFQAPASQARVIDTLSHCAFASLGNRGRWSLSAASWSWLQSRFVQVLQGDPDLWRRIP